MKAQPRKPLSSFFLFPSYLSPIAVRELGVAARRSATYRLRTYGVLMALIVVRVVLQSNAPGPMMGHEVLSALGVATLGFCMLAGLLLTANSIAAEREGGTIGLLFLTDLKGYDIVLGKLAAHSVNAFFGLLAVFPVLALPLLMGGVTGSEFARLLLVFGTTLLFSLCLGLAVSAMTSDPRKALGWAIMLMAVAAGLLPALWWLQRISLNVWWLDVLLWPSPAFAFRNGFDAWYRSGPGASDFWYSLQTIWVLTALCLAWASFITPRAWQTHEVTTRKLRTPKRKPRGWVQAEATNPYCRVTFRDWAPSSLANLLLAVAVPIWLCFLFSVPGCRPPGAPVPFLVCLFLGYALHVLVKLLMMVESVSRLNHDRNSGALELLLVTPLPVLAIIAAQRKALRAHFRWAIWTLCLLNLAMLSASFGWAWNLSIDRQDLWMFSEVFIGGIVVLLADFEALQWVGLWHGLSKRQANKAVIITAVQLLGPFWLLVFLVISTKPGGPRSEVLTILSLLFLAGLVVDAISFAVARARLFGRFRSVAAQRYDKAD
jgi:ABC-type transport system involved in multi-copper enzyme maturation permease subunit